MSAFQRLASGPRVARRIDLEASGRGRHLRHRRLARRASALPITDRQADYARAVQKQLDAAGIRATIDERNEKVNFKIREAQLQKIPFMLVVGDQEQENGRSRCAISSTATRV
jgi:histidyl-tRNA synthetase